MDDMSDGEPRFTVEFGGGWVKVGDVWVCAPGVTTPEPKKRRRRKKLGKGWVPLGYIDETDSVRRIYQPPTR